MIEVFASITSKKPDEVYHDHGMTVDAWMAKQAGAYTPGSQQPVSVSINGEVVPPDAWGNTWIDETDRVAVRVQPKGSDVEDAFKGYLGISFLENAVEWAVRQIVDVPGSPQPGQQGAEIQVAEAKANAPRLGGAIPEVFGRYIRYPDYLNQPRRYFVDNQTQALDLMMCVGAGEYEISEDDIKIGETPIANIDGLVSYEIFGPGDDVSGHQAHLNWYNAPEVGASVGSAGIRLKGADEEAGGITRVMDQSQILAAGIQIVVDQGSGTIPDDWEVGMFLEVILPQDVTVYDGGQDSSGFVHDIFEGFFPTFSDGSSADTVSVYFATGFTGASRNYLINTFTPGSPAQITLDTTSGDAFVAATAASASIRMAIEEAGVRYRIDSIDSTTIQLTRILPDGSEDSGWAGFDIEYFNDAVIRLDGSNFDGEWAGPFLACPENESTDTIELDVFAPTGVGVTNDSGGVDVLERSVEIQYRDFHTGGAWTSIINDVSAGTRNQQGWTFTESLGSDITPEVRMRRTSLENTATNALDRFEWIGLRSKLDTVTSYSGVTTIAMTLTGSDTISNQSETKVNIECTRKLPVLSGGALSSNTATRRIESAVIRIAQSIGYSTDQLDMDELERLGDIWASRGDTFDFVLSNNTVRDAMNMALRAGFAAVTVSDGIIVPVRDEERTTYEQAYSPANMTSSLRRTFQARRSGEPDGVEVEYVDGDTWTTETVLCGLPGDSFLKVEKIKLNGVTDRTRAWRIGMRQRRMQRYRRWVYEFETEMDALNSGYLSYVPLIDDIPGYGKTSIILSITPDTSGDILTLSEPMTWVDGETHVIAYRDQYGELVGPFTATRGDNDYQVIADLTSLPDLTARQEPPHAYFGTSTRWSFPALITDVSPQGPARVSVQAVNYDARVYADDDNAPS